MDDSVTVLIEHQVRADAVPRYEAWLKEIAQAARAFAGHMGVSIIRPHATGAPYAVLLRFDDQQHLRNWLESTVRRDLVARAEPWLVSEQASQIETGLEYWFTPPAVAPLRAKPYKQFLITVSAIYPLTQIVPWLLQPLLALQPLPRYPPLQALLVVLAIVFLMVYVVMPRYTRLVARWLFR